MNSQLKKGLQVVGLAAVLAMGLAATGTAEARGRAHVGIWVGGPFWWGGGPYGYYPYVVERPVIVQPPAETIVIQPSATQQANTWYYCRDAQMYYPHVTTCASPWQEVPATPPPAAQAPAPVPAATTNTAPAPAPTSAAPAPATRTAPAPVPPAVR